MNCFSGWVVDWPKSVEIAATAITTLAAAYFGAKFAFALQVRREKALKIATDANNANLAIFNIRRFRDLFQGLLECIETSEHAFDDHYLLMKPFSTFNIDGPRFSYEPLAFLLTSNESLLSRLAGLEYSLIATLELVKKRTELHYNFVQPAIEDLQREHNIEAVPENFPDLLAQKLGPRLDATMDSITTQMISGIREDIEICTAVANEIAEAVASIYPKKVIKRRWYQAVSA